VGPESAAPRVGVFAVTSCSGASVHAQCTNLRDIVDIVVEQAETLGEHHAT
jgi:hypothetical protein